MDVVICSNDPAEPNDTFPTATPLVVGGTASGLLCGEDLDTFRVQLVQNQCYQIQANFINADGDIDLYFLDEQERFEPFTSEGASDTETITVRNDLAAGDYFVVVLLYEPLAGDMNTYTVRVTSVACQ
jgi:hypothetical protein